MKPVFIVVFELARPSANQEALVRSIKENCDSWARVTSNAYLISTGNTVAKVRDTLKQHLLSDDRLFVGTAPAPAAWWALPDDVAAWLFQHQVGTAKPETQAK